MEKKMNKSIVTAALSPLDAAFAGISNLRKDDKATVVTIARKVRAAVKAEVLKDVTAALKQEEPEVKKSAVKKGRIPATKKVTSAPVNAKKEAFIEATKRAVAAKKGAKAKPVPVATKAADESLRGTSTVAKPTKLVWTIAERIMKANKNAKRADIMLACAKEGITFYTARTQYQLWKASRG